MPDQAKEEPKHSIYKKGMPFYKLTKKESVPSMNLSRTFDINDPSAQNYKKYIEKNKWSQDYDFAFEMCLIDAQVFAKDNNFSSCQTAALFEIFYSCFLYLSLLPALEKKQFCEYFRGTLILYAVQDPPECLRIFNGTQAFAIAKLFHELVVNNYEILKHVVLPVYEIEVEVSQIY